MLKMTTDEHQTCQQGCSGVGRLGTTFPQFFALVTLPEGLDFSFQFLRVVPGAT